jgi:hypothetical protein
MQHTVAVGQSTGDVTFVLERSPAMEIECPPLQKEMLMTSEWFEETKTCIAHY